jgi:hypothetical protein
MGLQETQKQTPRLSKIFYSIILDEKILVLVFSFLSGSVHAHRYHVYLVRVYFFKLKGGDAAEF